MRGTLRTSRSVRAVLLLGCAALLALSPLAADASSAVAPATPHPVFRVQFHGTTRAEFVASIGATVLVANQYSNGSNELVLFNASTNTSTTVQKVVPGVGGGHVSSMAAAGGRFYLAYSAYFTIGVDFETVSTAGAVAAVHLPLNSHFLWRLAFGNSTSLFASATHFGSTTWLASLVELNALSGTVIRNDSATLPSGIWIQSVLPVGDRYYLAGSALQNLSTAPFFAYLSGSGSHFQRVFPGFNTTPYSLRGAFTEMALLGHDVLVGGAYSGSVNSVTWGSTVGLLYRYFPVTGAFRNLSALLPHAAWGVVGLAHARSAVLLDVVGSRASNTSGSYTSVGGLYELRLGAHRLINLTGHWGPGYAPSTDGAFVLGSRYVISGGMNPGSGSAEIISFRR